MPKVVKGIYKKGSVKPEREVNIRGEREVIIFFKETPEESTIEKLSSSRKGKGNHERIEKIIEMGENGEIFKS